MKRNILKIFLTGVKKGWETPTLPDNLLNLQLHPIIRVLRVLGGFCTLLLITDKVKQYSLPLIVYIVAIIIAVIFLIYNIYITYHRFKHTYKTLKSDQLNIKNIPLDQYNTFVFKGTRNFNWKWLFVILIVLGTILVKISSVLVL